MGDLMGYKIQYGETVPKKSNFLRMQSMICVFLMIFTLFVRLFWPGGQAALRHLLVSDSLSRGAQAVMAMVLEMEAGESITDAVAVFCQEFIYGG